MSAGDANMPNNTNNGGAANRKNYSCTKILRVLLVNDSTVEQRACAAILGRFGVETEVVNNGREAIDIVHGGENYDMIMMDRYMPVMDGLEATQMLRSMGIETKIVGVGTANGDEEKKAEGHEFFMAGADDYVTKPIDAQVFAVLLQELDD